MKNKLAPVTPGEILLEEFLIPFEISQAKLAKSLNVPANRINQIVNGKREITADTAIRLGRFFSIEPEFWMNLQTHYNIKLAKSAIGDQVEKEIYPISA